MMNIKRLLTLLFAFTVAFLISSCATIQPNQKYFIGTWKAVNVEKIKIPNKPSNTAANAQNNTGEKIDSVELAKQSLRTERQLTRLTVTEQGSIITINTNKTGSREFRGKTEHATWNLKNKGTLLLATSKETGKKLSIDIRHINDTSAVVVVDDASLGRLKITYKKEKK